ncbi:hypothetical protein OG216_38435 [Streptomycetaceae bacterium NBC_01309]
MRLRTRLVEALLADPVAADPASSWPQDLRDQLRPEVAVPSAGETSVRFGALVTLLMNVPFGLAALVRVLGDSGVDASTTRTLQNLADEWQALTFFPDADWEELRALVGEFAPLGLQPLVHRAAEGRYYPDPDASDTTAWQAIVRLTTLNAPPSGLPPALALLALLVDTPEARSGLGRIRTVGVEQWARTWARQWDLEDEFVGYREAIREHAPSPVARALIVQITVDGLDPDRYHVTHWVQTDLYQWGPSLRGDRSVTARELPETVAALAEDAEASMPWHASDDLVVELIVPLSLVNSALARGSGRGREGTAHEDALSSHPTVVRSLERLQNRAYHRRWHARWERLRRSGGHVVWNNLNDHLDAPRLYARLAGDPDVVGCVLSAPPGDPAGDAELSAALQQGVPLVLWDAEDCGHPEFRTAAEGLLASGDLTDLPARLHGLRTLHDVPRRLVLLWDDPTRQPAAGAYPERPWSAW